MNPEELPLPRSVKEGARTYLISGGLGAGLFTASGLLWDTHPFLGSLLLELGGGAFIVFLLEFVLPRLFRVTELVWSPEALLSLESYEDKAEVLELLEGCRQATYPTRASTRNGTYDAGRRIEKHRVLKQRISSHSLLFYYVPQRGRLRKRVVIADVTKLSGLPRRSPDQRTEQPGPD